jgi:hypothetical protein
MRALLKSTVPEHAAVLARVTAAELPHAPGLDACRNGIGVYKSVVRGEISLAQACTALKEARGLQITAASLAFATGWMARGTQYVCASPTRETRCRLRRAGERLQRRRAGMMRLSVSSHVRDAHRGVCS